MNLLIIGSKGFIGSYIFRHFAADKNNLVYGCDLVTDYTTPNYFTIDASNANYHEIFEATAVDVCINCSGAASVPDSFEHPYRDFLLNTANVYAMLDAIKKHRPGCRYINLSSAAVYGNPQTLPISETSELAPLSPYAFHKLEAEQVCSEFNRFYNIQTCSLRIFTAYGRGLKKQLFWDIAQKTVRANNIQLFGTGNESRDFIHVHDIVQAMELIVRKGEFNGAVYNIANTIEITIANAANEFLQHLSWKGELTFNGEIRKGDPLNWWADIKKLKTLGYIQMVSIEDGLKDYAQWLREEKLV